MSYLKAKNCVFSIPFSPKTDVFGSNLAAKKNTNINHPSKIYLSGLPIIKTDINFDPQATHNRRLEGYIKKNVNSKNKVAKKLAGLGFISYLCS